MATAKPQRSTRPSGRRWARAALLLGAAAIALLVWFWRPLTGHARAAAAYGAHVACSCRYIGGRSLGDCRKDFEPGMGAIMLSEDHKAMSVTARFPPLSSQTATFRNGEGCMLEKWED